jgi:hypothetical protein
MKAGVCGIWRQSKSRSFVQVADRYSGRALSALSGMGQVTTNLPQGHAQFNIAADIAQGNFVADEDINEADIPLLAFFFDDAQHRCGVRYSTARIFLR